MKHAKEAITNGESMESAGLDKSGIAGTEKDAAAAEEESKKEKEEDKDDKMDTSEDKVSHPSKGLNEFCTLLLTLLSSVFYNSHSHFLMKMLW